MDDQKTMPGDEMRFRLVDGRAVPALDGGPDTIPMPDAIRQTGQMRQTLMATYAVVVELAADGMAEPEAVQALLWGWTQDPIKVVLRRSVLGELKNDYDLAAFLVACSHKQLNPWKGEAYPIVRYDGRSQRFRVHVGVTINTMRAIAHATNKYVGLDAPTHEYTDGPYPDSATLAAYKMVDGVRHKFAVTVYWLDYYPGGGADSLWDKMPHVCLDTVCEAALLRRMFPEQLDRLFASQEFSRRDAEPPPPRDADFQPTPDEPAVEVPRTEGPGNLAELHRAMAEAGVKSLATRDTLIRQMRRNKLGLEQANPRRFYAAVLESAKRDQKAWDAAG